MKNNRVSQAELQAFVHQKVEDLNVFLTDTSEVECIELPVKKYLKIKKENGELPEDFTAAYCYLLKITEEDSTLKAIGFGDHEFEAIKNAHQALYKKFEQITDQVISNTDHQNEIADVLRNDKLH